jgi:hypothetical protein
MDGRAAAAVLGVPERADLDTIRTAFRARARATHPDLGGDPAEFATTLAAFELLVRRGSTRSLDTGTGTERDAGRVAEPADQATTPAYALAATHGFVGYDSPRSPRPGTRRTFAEELRVALAREAAAPRR